MKKLKPYLFAFALIAAPILSADSAVADNSLPLNQDSYSTIDLSSPADSLPIKIQINREQCLAYHWHSGKKIVVQIYVEDAGSRKRFIWDRSGRKQWVAVVGDNLEASLTILPAIKSYTGRLNILFDNNLIKPETPHFSELSAFTLEKVYVNRFQDGAAICVHYTDQILDESGVPSEFPKQVLNAGVIAYQTITKFEGFGSDGYSFAKPNTSYAYDPDKTVDVYLGNAAANNIFDFHRFSSLSFRDAPCFDTVKLSDTAYQSVILLPANYREFIQNWERLNPSSLGARNTNIDLRGTLMHEMLHVILFYYNKNLNRESGETVNPLSAPKTQITAKKHLDWYVEGLARYFETFAGARHDFFSQGFRETLPDKIRFSRGGSNYYMRYPDQPFTELRYENALFWRFIDYQYGMTAIEKLSRSFRGNSEPDYFSRALEKATNVPFDELLQRFALASLLNDFGLKEDAGYLKSIAKTRLLFKDSSFYLLDGYDQEKQLGQICHTDWVGRWDTMKAHFEDLPIAGDNTDESDVSGWATDFYEISLDSARPELPSIKILHDKNEAGLLVQVVLRTKGGSVILNHWKDFGANAGKAVNLKELAVREGLTEQNIDKIFLLVTNLDPKKTANYEISAGSV